MPHPIRLLLVLLITTIASAQAPSTQNATEPGSELTVFLLTMGPGDMIFEKFGHNAILIEDRRTGQSYAFNYGIFQFDQGFIWRFLRGRMRYWMEAAEGRGTINYYTNIENRSVWLQELNLTPAQRAKLWNHLAWNVREENKYYFYNYYNANCSTRVRDALDLALDGQIAAQLEGVPTGRTYRWHTRRIVAGDPIIYTALSFVLGPNVDREISAWEESFLPEEFMKYLRNLTVVDGAGNRVPIVVSEQKLRTSTEYDTRATPPTGRIFAYLIVGLLVGAGFVLAARKVERRWVRWSFILGALFWSLLAGGAGAFLSWGFTTEHWSVYWNENWLQFNPVALGLLVAVPLAVRGGRRARNAALIVASIVLASSLVGFLLQVSPTLNQFNGEMVALMLPGHAGLAIAAYLLARRPDPAPAKAPAKAVAKQVVPPRRSGR